MQRGGIVDDQRLAKPGTFVRWFPVNAIGRAMAPHGIIVHAR
jgi:hypothetical protein